MGVVRQITPRSVVIRKKNSVTILVPNSVILTKAIYNWNYTRNFFAFDDIILTVPYSYDPVRIKAVIMQVLEQNINVLKNPAPVVFLRDFVENGYQFLVRGYLTADKVAEQWEIMSNVRIELVRHLHLAGMEIAMPTRRVIKMIEKEKEKSGTGKDGAKSVE
jgi:small-conductance mechanosensitive channel